MAYKKFFILFFLFFLIDQTFAAKKQTLDRKRSTIDRSTIDRSTSDKITTNQVVSAGKSIIKLIFKNL